MREENPCAYFIRMPVSVASEMPNCIVSAKYISVPIMLTKYVNSSECFKNIAFQVIFHTILYYSIITISIKMSIIS